jgi:hypothetical protein
LVAHQDVAFTERIGPIAIGFESLVDVKMDGEPHVVQAARARADRRGVDGPLEFDSAADAPRDERDLGWSRKRERPEVGDGDDLVHVEFATRTKNDAHVDFTERRHYGFALRPRNNPPIIGAPSPLVNARTRSSEALPRSDRDRRSPARLKGEALMDNLAGIRFGPTILAAARSAGLDPRFLAAVAAQESGGPDSDSGSNIVGDGGHGHGVFQLDDRWHAIARTPAAMDPAANADYAAHMLASLLRQYGGDRHAALSAYNTGSPTATGTTTTWSDGRTLGYADSVLRHLGRLEARDALLPDTGDQTAPAWSLGQLAIANGAGQTTAAPGLIQVPAFTPSTQTFRSYQSEYRDAAGSIADEDDRMLAGLIDPSDG